MRNLRIHLVAAAALALGVTACAIEPDQADSSAITTQRELRDDMRELWTAHVTWTRIYLIDAIAGHPAADTAADRLMTNQTDIGDAIRPFYGDAAADGLTLLLEEHITIATEIVAAAGSGDAVALDDATSRWFLNADAIASFLADANPFWLEADMSAMMRAHLEQTLVEATARLEGDWLGDVAAYDAVVGHALAIADVMTQGISDQFPGMVAVPRVSAGDEDLHLGMRLLWQDHVGWTRMFVMAAVAGSPDIDAVTERLLLNQDDIGNAIRPFYGDAAGDQLTALLHEHILGAAAVVTAAASGDEQELALAQAAWTNNADEIAAFLASANPEWPLEDLQSMMHAHLDQTTNEATARINGEHKSELDAYDAVVTHILMMADVLSAGISANVDVDASLAELEEHH